MPKALDDGLVDVISSLFFFLFRDHFEGFRMDLHSKQDALTLITVFFAPDCMICPDPLLLTADDAPSPGCLGSRSHHIAAQ
jgi:hypothetical protein